MSLSEESGCHPWIIVNKQDCIPNRELYLHNAKAQYEATTAKFNTNRLGVSTTNGPQLTVTATDVDAEGILQDIRAWLKCDVHPQSAKQASAVPLFDPSSPNKYDHLIGFALILVQQVIGSNVRREKVLDPSLRLLEASIIRRRASGHAIPPYSATQANFWVQIVHASITVVMRHQGGHMETLHVSEFKQRFHVAGDEWKKHYSPHLWESVSSRMEFARPNRKALPSDFGTRIIR